MPDEEEPKKPLVMVGYFAALEKEDDEVLKAFLSRRREGRERLLRVRARVAKEFGKG